MNLVIRVDGGSELGYGHLIRSKTLAEEFLNHDHEISVATTTIQPVREVFPDLVEIVELNSRDDPEPFKDWIIANLPDAVFTDSYPINTEYQRTIRKQVPLAVLQDDDRYAVCADLFVNGNLYSQELNYKFVGRKPKRCLGVDYLPLRSEIRKRAKDDPPWREQPKRALVTMGGSDIVNLTPTVLHSFDGMDIHVDAIIGPGFSEAQEHSVRTVAEKISLDVDVVRDPDNLAERMFQADFAVSTASSTTYELLALGTPIISVPVAVNQKPIAQALHERDLATIVKHGGDVGELQNSIKAYLGDGALRKNRQKMGRRLIDGRGVKRVYTELISLANES